MTLTSDLQLDAQQFFFEETINYLLTQELAYFEGKNVEDKRNYKKRVEDAVKKTKEAFEKQWQTATDASRALLRTKFQPYYDNFVEAFDINIPREQASDAYEALRQQLEQLRNEPNGHEEANILVWLTCVLYHLEQTRCKNGENCGERTADETALFDVLMAMRNEATLVSRMHPFLMLAVDCFSCDIVIDKDYVTAEVAESVAASGSFARLKARRKRPDVLSPTLFAEFANVGVAKPEQKFKQDLAKLAQIVRDKHGERALQQKQDQAVSPLDVKFLLLNKERSLKLFAAVPCGSNSFLLIEVYDSSAVAAGSDLQGVLEFCVMLRAVKLFDNNFELAPNDWFVSVSSDDRRGNNDNNDDDDDDGDNETKARYTWNWNNGYNGKETRVTCATSTPSKKPGASRDDAAELRQLGAADTSVVVAKRAVTPSTGTITVLSSASSQCVFKLLRADEASELRAAERERDMLLSAARAGCAPPLLGVAYVDVGELPSDSAAYRSMAATNSRRAIVLRMQRGTALPASGCEIDASSALQVLRVVDALHKTGVVHLDLKPANVVQMADGSTKLIDFGFARTLTVDGVCHTRPKGTVGYMSANILHALQEERQSVTVTRYDDLASLVAMFERHGAISKSMSALIRACKQVLRRTHQRGDDLPCQRVLAMMTSKPSDAKVAVKKTALQPTAAVKSAPMKSTPIELATEQKENTRNLQQFAN